MPRLTAELIAESPQFTNPVKDWELDLRGNKIAVIENLGATLDQFDTIDFSDNEIRKLDGFPLLRRLKSIFMANNNVCRIGGNLEEALPSLETLVLTNNNIEDFSDLEQLASVKTLTYLSLLRNPVVHKSAYRYYMIHLLPNLRVLDFKRIRLREKQKAKEMFGVKKQPDPAAAKPKIFTPGGEKKPAAAVPTKPVGPSATEIARIREAIAGARSLDEVQQLEAMLKSGQLPTAEALAEMAAGKTGGHHSNGQVEEMDED